MTATDDLETFRLFIDGKSVDARLGKTFESAEPLHRPAVGDDRRRRTRGHRPRGRRRPAPRSTGSGARKTGFERAAIMRDVAAADHRQRRAAGAARGARLRQADARDARPAHGAGQLVPLLLRASPTSSRARRCRRSRRRPTSATRCASRSASSVRSRRGTARCCCSPSSWRRCWRPAAPAWSSRRSTRPPPPSRSPRCCTRPGCRPACSTSSPAGTAATGEALAVAHRRRQGRLHRVDRDRGEGRPGGGGEHQQGHPRARRQVAPGRLRRRRPRRGRQRPGGRCLRGDRPDLHGRFAADRARVGQGRAGRQGRRARQIDQAGRPDRRRDRDGAGGQPAAVREGPRLPRRSPARRAPRSPAAASRTPSWVACS